MRILMLLDQFFPPDIRVEKEAKTLLQAGHEVFLLSLFREDAPTEEMVAGIKVIRFRPPYSFRARTWDRLWFQTSFIHPFWRKALIHFITNIGAEVLHIHDLPMAKTGLSAAHKFKIPLIADLHENFPEAVRLWQARRKGRSRLLSLLQPLWRWKQLERYCVGQADRVITVVEEAKQHYIRDCGAPPQKVEVVMNVEDLDYFGSLAIDKDIVKKYEPFFTISYIGAIAHHRGIQTAISAMPIIKSKIPHALLLLIGEKGPGLYTSELKALVKEKGIEDSVEFLGWQNFSLLPSFIEASKVCLVPHISSGHTDSTIPHKLFQYMAMGKPVIVSSAKPLERIITETGAGLVYPSGDSNALAEAVIKIYEDSLLATRLGKAGKEAVRTTYNWSAEGKKLVKLYQDIQRSPT